MSLKPWPKAYGGARQGPAVRHSCDRRRPRPADRGSLQAQGPHGIDAGGAQGREGAGREGGQEEPGRDRGQGERVAGPDPEQQVLHHAAERERPQDPQTDSDGGEGHALAHDQAEHVRRPGAEGDAHADLARPLAHREGDDTVGAHGGQQQGHGGEAAQ